MSGHRKFDHAEAERRVSAGEPVAQVARSLGVSRTAVARVVDPALRERMDAASRVWIASGRCPDCGGPSTRHATNKPMRCHTCASKARANVRADGTVFCPTCSTWKPSGLFSPSQERPHRGFHIECRSCDTARRRESRRRKRNDVTFDRPRDQGAVMAPKRQSIAPTYDHRETGDRYTVDTRINDKRLNEITTRDPFVHHRVVIGWRDLIRFALQGRTVTMIVGGDPEIVDDVMELDADCLTLNSTRRDEWSGHVESALGGAEMGERADELRALIWQLANPWHRAKTEEAALVQMDAEQIASMALTLLDALLAELEAARVLGDGLRAIVVELARFSRVAVENGDLHARAASALALWEEATSGGGSDA